MIYRQRAMIRENHKFIVALLICLIAFNSYIGSSQTSNFRSQAEQLLGSEQAKTMYWTPFKLWVEGVSLVRYIYGGAEYLLLGAPSLTLSLVGGPAGPIKKIGWDLVTEMIKEACEDPEKASRKIAKSTYDMGLDAYRDNYSLYQKYKDTGRLTNEEYRRFVINWYIQDYMSAAKNLYSATSRYEGKDELKHPDTLLLKAAETTSLQMAKEAFGAADALELNLIVKATKGEFTAFDSLIKSSVGLGAYPPYQSFLTHIRKTN
jgi:hypothetical protein